MDEFNVTLGINLIRIILFLFWLVIMIKLQDSWTYGKRPYIVIPALIIGVIFMFISIYIENDIYTKLCTELKGQSELVDCSKYNDKNIMKGNKNNE